MVLINRKIKLFKIRKIFEGEMLRLLEEVRNVFIDDSIGFSLVMFYNDVLLEIDNELLNKNIVWNVLLKVVKV